MRQNIRQLAFDWGEAGAARPSPDQGSNPSPAPKREGTLAQGLMEAIVAAGNMRQALKRVRANKGSPGVDGMTVDEVGGYLKREWPRIRQELLEGTYQPEAVKRVEIPKPGGGKRQLGIPTAVDRVIQQAILQVLTPIYDPTFSAHSYGFRPWRSAHQAVAAAREHVASGRGWVVDLDLEKFFDRVNHDVLMGRLAQRIGDRRLLGLIRRYLEAGVMLNGVVMEREEGTPQGGPLSPLLANILLDELDKELERRGHRFCRYADDCNIYVQSQRAGERVMASVTQFLEKKLRLRVNRDKSAVAEPVTRKFLGFRIRGRGAKAQIGIAPRSREKAEERIRRMTARNRGKSIGSVLEELRSFTDGWVAYFWKARTPSVFEKMDRWVRRRLRCYLWKQWRTPRNRARNLIRRGVAADLAWRLAYSRRGPWAASGWPTVWKAVTKARLTAMGYHSLHDRYLAFASR